MVRELVRRWLSSLRLPLSTRLRRPRQREERLAVDIQAAREPAELEALHEQIALMSPGRARLDWLVAGLGGLAGVLGLPWR